MDEQYHLFPMADPDEIAYEAIFEARRLTELDASRVRRRPWLGPDTPADSGRIATSHRSR